MAEWSVEMLARNEMTPVEVEERIEDLLENLDAYGGVVSYGAEGISARFFVEGERAKDAVWRGLRVFASAL